MLEVDKNIKKDVVDINSKTSSNLTEINKIKNDLTIKIREDVFNETHIISNFSKSYNNYKIFELNFDNQFTNDGLLKLMQIIIIIIKILIILVMFTNFIIIIIRNYKKLLYIIKII